MRAGPPLLVLVASWFAVGCSNEVNIPDKLNRPPAVSISNPKDGTAFTDLDKIDFLGVVADADGLADIDKLEWTSDQIDTPLGTLDTTPPDTDGYTHFASTLPAGAHAITLTVVDHGGQSAVASVSVVVSPHLVDPSAEITVPAPGATFYLGDEVLLIGNVQDPNQSADSLTAVWTFSTDYGARTEIDSLRPTPLGGVQSTWIDAPVGQHQLFLTVTDDDGHTGEVTIAINIVDPDADDADGDGFPANHDCDDHDPNRNPGLDETCDGVDNDCNGIIDDKDLDSDLHVDEACDLYPGAMPIDDCLDSNGTVYPGAAEQYDGLDNDCNGKADDGLSEFDNDGDCYCSAPTCNGGSINPYCYYVVLPGDCDDTDASLNPRDNDADGASSCDGDCDDADPARNLLDADGDGTSNCAGDCDDANPVLNVDDADLDGASSCAGDCNDADALLNLLDVDTDGATSCGGDCNDGDPALNLRDLDLDGYSSCSGDCNDSDPLKTPDDLDGDGASACAGDCDDGDPAKNLHDVDLDGFTTCANDCDDTDAVLTPGDVDADGTSSCDGDCNDLSAVLNVNDADSDGFTSCGGDCNDANAAANLNDFDGDGFSTCTGDCNDLLSALSPADVDGDGFSTCTNDCDDGDPGQNPADLDADGVSSCAGDCDDFTASVHPGGTEIPYNGLDDDCLAGDLIDVDGDGKTATQAGGKDCDDNDPTVHPGATEVCNNVDDDCDGDTDPNNSVGCTSFFHDGDDDGFGTGSPHCQCGPKSQSGYTSTVSTDCFDSNQDAFPGETTFYSPDRGDNSWDYNCDGSQTKKDTRTATYSCVVTVTIFPPSITCTWGAGWETSGNPACGSSKNWATQCQIAAVTNFCSPLTLTPVNQTCK